MLACLPRGSLGRVVLAVLAYARDGVEPAGLSRNEQLAFENLRVGVDLDARRYDERCEKNRLCGTKGGRPRSRAGRGAAEAGQAAQTAPAAQTATAAQTAKTVPAACADAAPPAAGRGAGKSKSELKSEFQSKLQFKVVPPAVAAPPPGVAAAPGKPMGVPAALCPVLPGPAARPEAAAPVSRPGGPDEKITERFFQNPTSTSTSTPTSASTSTPTSTLQSSSSSSSTTAGRGAAACGEPPAPSDASAVTTTTTTAMLLTFWNENFGPANGYIRAQIALAQRQGLAEDLIRLAMDRALFYAVPKWAYVRRVLDEAQALGAHTAADYLRAAPGGARRQAAGLGFAAGGAAAHGAKASPVRDMFHQDWNAVFDD